jgi:hypothetical protein
MGERELVYYGLAERRRPPRGKKEALMRAKLISFVITILAVSTAAFAIEAFRVTGVSVSVSEPEYRGFCPHKFIFTGRITANREGTVRFTWLRSDGIPRKTYILAFEAAGTKTVTHEWELGGAMGTYRDRWAQIEVLAPNSVRSNQAEFDLECLPQMQQAERKFYTISGRLISYASQAPFLEMLAGGRLKVHVASGGRTVRDEEVPLTSSGIASYAITLINAPGTYLLTVEPLSLSARIIWQRTDPVSRTVTLTEASPTAVNQNFTFYYAMSGML